METDGEGNRKKAVKPCRHCNKYNSSGCFLFKTNSIFLNHIDVHIDENTNAKGPRAVCIVCCESILKEHRETNEYVGYLTTRQHREYRKYAKISDKLHYEGYVVVDRNVSMHLGFLMHLIMKNKKNIAPLIKGEGRQRTKTRMWIELKTILTDGKDQVELKNNRDELGTELGKIINPDYFFGMLAKANRNLLLGLGADEPDNQSIGKYEVTGEAVLYRSTGEKGKQTIHKDAHDGSYNIVEALTKNYQNVIFPYTHLLETWDQNTKPTIYGKGKTVTLQNNQMLVMHSNTIHCGGSSCGINNNFDPCLKKMKKMYLKLLKERKVDRRCTEPSWFLTGQNTRSYKITDMSIHRTVDSLRGRPGSSEMVTGKTNIFPANHIPTEPDMSDKKYLDYIGQIKQGKCLYHQASGNYWPHGKGIPIHYPCSGVINEAKMSVERLVTGGQNFSTRRSMRVVEQRQNDRKRKKPDQNGLRYCTCVDCQKSKH